MKKIAISLLVTILIALSMLLVGSARSDVASATGIAEPDPVICTVDAITGSVAHFTCTQGGVVLPPGQQPPDLPIQPIISYVPTEIPVPGPTKIIRKVIRVPQPRQTVTLPPRPGPTQTQTIRVPGPTKTEFIRPPARTIRPPARTVTAPPVTDTVSVPGPTQTVTRQAKPERDTIVGKGNPEPFGMPYTDTVIEKVGLGLLALAGLVGLILLGLWLGYALGYKDRDRSEAQFLQALRQQLVGRSLDK